MTLRDQPFRLLFPLSFVVAALGVLPWVLFARGAWPGYPALLHAFTMTEAFLTLAAAGFLGTMLPRRMKAAPFTRVELGLVMAGLLAVPVLTLLGAPALGQAGFALGLLTLLRFVAKRAGVAMKTSAALPSFVLLPLGLVGALAGAPLIALGLSGRGPEWSLALGRLLVEEGLLLSMILALAPMLTPAILRAQGSPPPQGPAHRRQLALHGLTGLLLFGSFPLQLAAPAAGLALRGIVVLGHLVVAGNLLLSRTKPGIHRALYRVALALVPAGPLAAATNPAHRIAFMHLTFVGGFSLLLLAVASHVVLMHTGREAVAAKNPRWVIASGALFIAAMLVRAGADFVGAQQEDALLTAALLWIAGAATWTSAVTPMLGTPDAEG